MVCVFFGKSAKHETGLVIFPGKKSGAMEGNGNDDIWFRREKMSGICFKQCMLKNLGQAEFVLVFVQGNQYFHDSLVPESGPDFLG